jgi:hypothetical protein
VLTDETPEEEAEAEASSRKTLTAVEADGTFAVTVHGLCTAGESHALRPDTVPVDSLMAVTAPPTARMTLGNRDLVLGETSVAVKCVLILRWGKECCDVARGAPLDIS